MDQLLKVSAELLEETGVDGFNTNLLAERAGISVRAIYRYFPNKWAILVEMAERLSALERGWIGDLGRLGDGDDVRLAVERAVDGYYEAARQHPGYAALRAASQASPELRHIDERSNGQLEQELAETLRQAGVTMEADRLEALCQVVIEASNRLLDIALQAEPRRAALIVGELKLMIAGLLGQYL